MFDGVLFCRLKLFLLQHGDLRFRIVDRLPLFFLQCLLGVRGLLVYLLRLCQRGERTGLFRAAISTNFIADAVEEAEVSPREAEAPCLMSTASACGLALSAAKAAPTRTARIFRLPQTPPAVPRRAAATPLPPTCPPSTPPVGFASSSPPTSLLLFFPSSRNST